MASLDHSESVKRLHRHHVTSPGGAQRRDARHPEMSVRHIRRLVIPLASQEPAERRHVGQQLVFGQRRRRAGRHVDDGVTVRGVYSFG